MPAARRPDATSEVFVALRAEGRALGEDNDCAVKALAVACSVTYAQAHATLAHQGRRPGRGTPLAMTVRAAEALGFRLRRWTYLERQALMLSYPGADPERVRLGRTHITTHHPARFPRQWAARSATPLLLRVDGHILAVRDGRVCDWSEGRSLRVREIYSVERI